MRDRDRWYGSALVLAGVMAVVIGFPRGADADINGDGTDEVGAFAVEVTGLARGPWYQVFEADGSLVASQFLSPAFSQYQFLTIDTNGDGSDELVALSIRNSDGAALLEVRAAGGSVLASGFILGGAFSQHQLFKINYNGGAAEEIGVGFVQTSNGVGSYKVLTVSGNSIVTASSAAITGTPFSSLDWQAGDFDGDSNEEVFVGYRRTSDGAAAYTVWDPQTNTVLGSRFITGSPVTGHQWVVADFDSTTPGVEILVGFRKVSDGAAAYQVWPETGSVIASRFITGSPFSGHDWRAVADGTDNQIFVGFRRNSDGAAVYQVWNPATNTSVGGAFALGGASTLVDWLTGDFDGNAANGGEVLVGFVQNSNGSIGYQQWTRAGVQNSSKFVLGGTSFNPSFKLLRPSLSSRDDVMIGAVSSTGQPLVQLWNTNGAGTQILSKLIFNTDVR